MTFFWSAFLPTKSQHPFLLTTNAYWLTFSENHPWVPNPFPEYQYIIQSHNHIHFIRDIFSACSQFTLDFIYHFITDSLSALKPSCFAAWSPLGLTVLKSKSRGPNADSYGQSNGLIYSSPLFVFRQILTDEENHLSYDIAA